MRPEDKGEFAALLTGLAELHGRKLSRVQLRLYWLAFADLAFDDVRKAVEIHARSGGKFFPVPSELRSLVCTSVSDRAALAWDRVMGALGSIGTYASVVFDDPAIHAAISSMGGWIKFGQLEPSEWTRKEFERLHRAYANRIAVDGVRSVQVPAVLVGICDVSGPAEGRKPKLIGEREAATAWRSELDAEKPAQIEGGAKAA